jgi:hypothetical protein
VLARQENTVALGRSAKLAFVAFLLLGFAVVLVQLALESQTAAQLELSSVFEGKPLALHAFGRQPHPGSN